MESEGDPRLRESDEQVPQLALYTGMYCTVYTVAMLVTRLMELTQYQLRRMRELGPRFHLLHPGGDPEMVNICFWCGINLFYQIRYYGHDR